MPLIFISHASSDRALVDDFVDLLQKGYGIRKDSIICAAVDGAGIDSGSDFVHWTRDNLAQAELVIPFLTPGYYASQLCIAEMGAAWALGKEVFPMAIPDMDRDEQVAMLGRRSAVIDADGLDELRDRLAYVFPSAAKRTRRWTSRRDRFLREFRRKLDEEVLRLGEQLIPPQLPKEGQGTVIEYAGDLQEAQQDPLSAVQAQLRKLTSVEVRCLFALVTGKEWVLGFLDYGPLGARLEEAVSRGTVELVRTEEDMSGHTMAWSYTAREDHDVIDAACDALFALDSFLDEHGATFGAGLMSDRPADTTDLKYWEEVLYGKELPA